MIRTRLTSVILLLAAVPAIGFAEEPRIADVRVGQHGSYERIVVELETEVAVRWLGNETGAEIFEIAARPLLARQLLATGRPRVGEMLLLAHEPGTHLRLEPQARRIRAFMLSNPARLVIDIGAPGAGSFDAPEGVRAIERNAASEQAPEPAPPAPLAEAEPIAAEPESATLAETPTNSALEAPLPQAEADVASAEPGSLEVEVEKASWLSSRALLVPLLAGIGVLLLAAGGLALASAQRSRPKRRAERVVPSGLELAEIAASADRLDLMEKRLDEEVRARVQLEEQLAQMREEFGGMRDVFARLRAQAAARSAAPSAPQ